MARQPTTEANEPSRPFLEFDQDSASGSPLLAKRLVVTPKADALDGDKPGPTSPGLVPEDLPPAQPLTQGPPRSLEELRQSFQRDQSSGLLGRLKHFIPELKAANFELERRTSDNPLALNMEHIDSEDEHYVEMNLGLGVFDKRDAEGGDDGEVDISTDKVLNPSGTKPSIRVVDSQRNSPTSNDQALQEQ
ncbi:hypothetical protein H4R34_000337 [Dimargaris verticillata]|uniref:Uncharacterized protein n=1 Tax=Dimargaris verticillata TaxID=2761393 RepID=A0A9W8B5K1_9FUNG|nr:hypothetical protein H4R34_000337 [Dimargaris verticillata]